MNHNRKEPNNMPPVNQMKHRSKPKNIKKTLLRIFSYMMEFKYQLIVIFVGIIFSTLAQVIGTSLLKTVIDNYIEPLMKQYDAVLFGKFIRTLVFMAGIYIIGAASTFLFMRIMLRVSTRTLYKIRTDLFSKMETLPTKYFDTHTHGDLMSRFTNDTDTIREMLNSSVANFVSSAVMICSVFVVMLWYSWQLTILVVLMLFVMLNAVKVIGGKSSAYFKEQQKALGQVNGHIEEMFEGQKVVKVFCHEDAAKQKFEELNNELCEAAANANTFANILMPVMGNLSYILYALTAVAGGILVLMGSLTLGTVVAFLQFTRSFSQPVTQISQQLNAVLTAMAGAERIFTMIDEKPEENDGYVTLVNVTIDKDGTIKESKEHTGYWAWKHPHQKDNTVTYTQVKGDVKFEQVTFGYDEKKTVLNDISLFANPGEKIAFVGSTGAGKTTITNLINRFYDISNGKIRYDGININKINKNDLRRSLAMVLQDTHLFTGTVMENIRYGRLNATDEEVIEAAKLANAHFFITHLPQGYNTILTSDGGNLSQGQRQLLAIARAAVADPPVLILDEATSSIDTRTEALIEKGMDQLMEGRTVFVIAHRLSTVRNSQAIMVLENGQIIERGSHVDLIDEQGKYYQLYTGMFELS